MANEVDRRLKTADLAAQAYRLKAGDLAALARDEKNTMIKAELESLAASYLRLAMQASANSLTDVAYETPLQKQPLQPQQTKLKEGDDS